MTSGASYLTWRVLNVYPSICLSILVAVSQRRGIDEAMGLWRRCKHRTRAAAVGLNGECPHLHPRHWRTAEPCKWGGGAWSSKEEKDRKQPPSVYVLGFFSFSSIFFDVAQNVFYLPSHSSVTSSRRGHGQIQIMSHWIYWKLWHGEMTQHFSAHGTPPHPHPQLQPRKCHKLTLVSCLESFFVFYLWSFYVFWKGMWALEAFTSGPCVIIASQEHITL